MSRITRFALLLTFFFALDKVAAFIRQVIIARQFGLSHELDAFNVANNVPDLLYAMISGGALAIAFIPVLTATLTRENREKAWELFSHVMNLFFLITAVLSLGVFAVSGVIVQAEFGLAPGFGVEQQMMVVSLMRWNLVATLIFSISGLVMAGLQANQHFLLPAMAPLMYNLGQIFGALVLAPAEGYRIAGITLPAYGLGVHGLVFGVILGAGLHLLIQVPGLLRHGFRWTAGLGLRTEGVRQVLRLMGPRIMTVFFVQLIFLIRDNLASRLDPGSVTALSYGWMIQQVPETLIGTAIGTAMLPSLSALAARAELVTFQNTLEKAARVLVGLTIPIAAVLAVGLGPVLGPVFDFGESGTAVLLRTTRAFLAGLTGHCLMEIAARGFYARQDARTPLIASGLNLLGYLALSVLLYRPLGPAGLGLTDTICWTAQAAGLLWWMGRRLNNPIRIGFTWVRALAGAGLGAAVTAVVLLVAQPGLGELPAGLAALAAGGVAGVLPLVPELRILLKL